MSAIKWERLPVVQGGPNPCLNCPPIESLIDESRRICVGFGYAALERDGEVIWFESDADDFTDCMSVADAERVAAADPDHDWRIVLNGPRHGETYQRHGPNYWVLVERNEGFA